MSAKKSKKPTQQSDSDAAYKRDLAAEQQRQKYYPVTPYDTPESIDKDVQRHEDSLNLFMAKYPDRKNGQAGPAKAKETRGSSKPAPRKKTARKSSR